MPYRTSLFIVKPSTEPRLRSRLEEVRVAAGMSRRELARRAGFNEGNLLRIELRRQRCIHETAERIAQVLGVEVGEVFEG